MQPSRNKTAFSAVTKPSYDRWHCRLGHPSSRIVDHVLGHFNLQFNRESNKAHVCDACQQGKSHQLPYASSSRVTSFPLELIFSDVWGPACTSSGGFSYYVSFIDDFSKFTWLFCLKHKSDVFNIFHRFQSHVERLLNRKILQIQTDWGGEYRKLNTFFQNIGIEHHLSCPHTHQQNGSAERKHRHVVETGLTLLAQASMPLRFWDEAFHTACFLINRLPTRTINMNTPLQRLFGTAPDYTFLRTFGCACWPDRKSVV